MTRQPPIDYIQRTREQYDALGYTPYQWVHNDDTPPFAPLKKAISQSKVALIGSGGVYRRGQIAFHFKDDTSFRIIDAATPAQDMRATHFAYDLTDARRDHNVVFPTDTLRALAASNTIGTFSDNAYAFMGGIYSTRRVREQLAPALVQHVLRDEVDLAILVPV